MRRTRQHPVLAMPARGKRLRRRPALAMLAWVSLWAPMLAMPAWDRAQLQESKSPGEVPMPAMPVWEWTRPEGQLPQVVTPAPAMSARDTARLCPPLC